MTDEWQRLVLGDLVERVRRRVPVVPHQEYRAVSVLRDGLGLGPKEPFVGGQTNYSSLLEVHSGDVVVRTITAFEAPVAVAACEDHGTHVSQVFLTYTVQDRALPEYLRLVFQTPTFWKEMSNRAQGSVLRRKTISDGSFRSIPIALPPLKVQRRIVDVVEVVDDHLARLTRETEALDLLLRALLEEWHAQGAAAAGLPPLGELAVIRSGPSWAANAESNVPSYGSARVLKITNTKQDGSLDLTGRTYVRGLPATTLLLDDRSLIVIRTNGNRDRIGNVYRPSPEALGCAVSAFQFIVQATDGSTRDRIYWALRAPSAQSAMSEAASGTTGLGNLAAGWLKARPIVELTDRTHLTLEDTNRQLELLRNEHGSLRVVRTQLLQALVSGDVEVLEAYDRLVDAGVA